MILPVQPLQNFTSLENLLSILLVDHICNHRSSIFPQYLKFFMTADIQKYPIESCPQLLDWVQNHPKAAECISFEENTSSFISFFSNKSSNSLYEKYIEHLTNFLSLAQKEKEKAIKTISNVSSKPVMKVGRLCFDSMSQNIYLRKITFAYRLRQEKQLLLSNSKFSLYLEKEEEATQLIELFQSSIIPAKCICRINTQNFILLSYPPEWTKLTFQIECLTSYLDRVNHTISQQKIPLWASDFNSYFQSTINESLLHFDSGICYIPPISMETELSRSIFGGFCDMQPKIDAIVNNFTKMSSDDWIRYVLDESMSLSPDKNPQKSSEQQSIELLIFFRIIFDRLYEKHSNLLFKNYENLMHKTEELSNLKFSYFHMPEGSSPVCENENSTIREIFKNDVNFLPAAQFLEMMNFIVNPIDALYSVHKFLLSINKGALMHRLSGTEASFNDLQELLSFDDLFILMLGVLLSADIPEFASITNFIRVYSPTFCLSNSFDYAQAGIESLLVHIESLDIEGFVNKSMAKPE